MSQRNGDKSRFQIARKRAVLRRARIRAVVEGGPGERRPAHAKRRLVKPSPVPPVSVPPLA